MAHGITNTDHMAYAGATPWHGLGTAVSENMSIEDMLIAAKLTWRVETAQLHFISQMPPKDSKQELLVTHPSNGAVAGFLHPVGDKVMYRSDTGHVLDTVGRIYTPAQNDEVLEFFREYVEVGKMRLETAGSLWGGRWVWGLARLNVEFELAGGDKVTGYLLVANPNKYGAGLTVKFVAERVVCHNTLTAALRESTKQIVIAHNRAFDKDARDDAKKRIGLAVDTFARLEKQATAFAGLHLSDKQVDSVLEETFDIKDKEKKKPIADRAAAKRIKELYAGKGIGAELPSAAGTGWGLLNAVTQFVDHESGNKKTTQDARLRVSWFGNGENLKNRTVKALWAEVDKK